MWSTQEEKIVKPAHVTLEDKDRMLDLVGELQESNFGEDAGLTVAKKHETEQEHNGTEEEVKENSSKRQTPDSGLG